MDAADTRVCAECRMDTPCPTESACRYAAAKSSAKAQSLRTFCTRNAFLLGKKDAVSVHSVLGKRFPDFKFGPLCDVRYRHAASAYVPAPPTACPVLTYRIVVHQCAGNTDVTKGWVSTPYHPTPPLRTVRYYFALRPFLVNPVCSPTCLRRVQYWPSVALSVLRCPVLIWRIGLRAFYAMSSTDRAYAATRRRRRKQSRKTKGVWAGDPTDIVYLPMRCPVLTWRRVLTAYAMSGTGLA
eukprot:2874220-Rhodomonas_salina.1